MAATTLPATATGCCILAQLLLFMSLPASGLNCMRTDHTGQKHSKDCGPKALGCRILVHPYRVYNDSAVGICRDGLKGGEFIYDCAVDCPQSATQENKLDWNEPLCCKGENNCNDKLELVIKKNYCYIYKTDSKERDTLAICSENQRCALNVVTRDTQCVDESECSQKDKWLCCNSKDNCSNTHGMPKVESLTQDDDSLDASNLTASLLMSVSSVMAFCVTVL